MGKGETLTLTLILKFIELVEIANDIPIDIIIDIAFEIAIDIDIDIDNNNNFNIDKAFA